MATIVVNDLNHVTVEGVQAGSVTDVLINYARVDGIRGDLLASLGAWHEANQRCHGDQCRTMQDAHEADLAALSARHAAELSAQADQIKNLGETIADQQAQIDALGGTELGKKLACEARRNALLDAKAKAEAELEALDGKVVGS